MMNDTDASPGLTGSVSELQPARRRDGQPRIEAPSPAPMSVVELQVLFDGTASSVRARLHDVEAALSELWLALVAEEPVLAARVSAAARFARKAASALGPENLL